MTWGELATILTDLAQSFRNEAFIKQIVPPLTGQTITRQKVRQLMNPFIGQAATKLPADMRRLVRSRFEEFVPEAMNYVRRSSRMNEADGTNIVSQANADAILCAFLNEAVIPLDLGLYTRHLVSLDEKFT